MGSRLDAFLRQLSKVEDIHKEFATPEKAAKMCVSRCRGCRPRAGGGVARDHRAGGAGHVGVESSAPPERPRLPSSFSARRR